MLHAFYKTYVYAKVRVIKYKTRALLQRKLFEKTFSKSVHLKCSRVFDAKIQRSSLDYKISL